MTPDSCGGDSHLPLAIIDIDVRRKTTLTIVDGSWIERGLLPVLRGAASNGLPVTVVVGPRACGKTTLVRRLVEEGVYQRYVSFADPGVRAAASASPLLFVESLPIGTVIDEAQLVPEVLVPIKEIVDATGRPGHFLLTGSTRVDLPTMGGTHPLAGRMARYELGPLNAAERHGRPTTSITTMLEGDPSTLAVTNLKGVDYDVEAATTGFPLLVTSTRRSSAMASRLPSQRHPRDVERIRPRRRSPTSDASPRGDRRNRRPRVGAQPSRRRPVDRPPNSCPLPRPPRRDAAHPDGCPDLRSKATDTERAVPKLHMVDPILVAPDPGGVSDDRRGALLESFVVNEIASQLEWVGGTDGLFHWRDRRRDEVDLVIEADRGFIAVEVKRAREVPSNATAGIDAFRARYPKQFRRGLVLYAGPHVLPLGDAVWAVPISALWSRNS